MPKNTGRGSRNSSPGPFQSWKRLGGLLDPKRIAKRLGWR